MQWQTLFIFLDDVIVIARNFEEMIERLRELFRRLISAGLKIKPKKMQLMEEKVSFLGHRITKDGIMPELDTVKCIKEWPTPKSLKETRAILGLVGYYRKFIRSLRDRARPLYHLEGAGQAFEWTQECDDAFQDLKGALTGEEVLASTEGSHLHFRLRC